GHNHRAAADNKVRCGTYQLRCVGWDSVQISTVIPIIDSDIAVLNPSEPLKCLAKRSDARLYYRSALGEWMHKHDPPHALRLLRARRERPRGRTAEQRDELAPLQVIELHSVPSQGRIAGYRIRNDQSGGAPLCVNYLTLRNLCRWQPGPEARLFREVQHANATDPLLSGALRGA